MAFPLQPVKFKADGPLRLHGVQAQQQVDKAMQVWGGYFSLRISILETNPFLDFKIQIRGVLPIDYRCERCHAL